MKRPTENYIVRLNQQGFQMDYGKTLIKDKRSNDYVDLTYGYLKNDIVIQFVLAYYFTWKKKKKTTVNSYSNYNSFKKMNKNKSKIVI